MARTLFTRRTPEPWLLVSSLRPLRPAGTPSADIALLAGECQNVVLVSDELHRELQSYPIPTDLEAAMALSSRPAALHLYPLRPWQLRFAAGTGG